MATSSHTSGSKAYKPKVSPVKAKKVADLAEKLAKAHMAVVTDYRGMKMAEISDLRSQLRKVDTEFHVTKNTFVRLAGTQTGHDSLARALAGTTAIAFCFGDVAAPAKILADFARTSKTFAIRAALLQGQLVPADRLMAIANLPARPVLQAQFLGALQGPMAGLVGVLSSPMQGLLAVLQARAAQLGGN